MTAQYMTPEEVAEMVRLKTPVTILRAVRDGRLPGARIGNRIVISREIVEQRLKDGNLFTKP